MRPTLFYIPPELFGIPLFGFGLFFWIIAAVTLATMIRALIRKNRDDFWSNLMLGSVAMVIIAWLAPMVGSPEGFPIRGYGVFLMLAILAAAAVILYLGKKRGASPEILLPIMIVQVVCGILGARIFYITEYWETIQAATAAQTFANAVNLTRGGLVVFGSIIGGTAGSFIYLKWKKFPILATLDLAAPALMIGLALGRLGCLMNGCCFGAPVDCCGITFPVGSPAHFEQMENGTVSLGGFTLAEPEKNAEEENRLFSIKETKPKLRSDVPAAVTIASVDTGSEAENAGLEPGMTILRMGLIPESKGLPTEREIQQAMLIPVTCNDDIFRFMLYESGSLTSNPTILFDTALKAGEKKADKGKAESGDADKGDNSEKAGSDEETPKYLRLAFHAGPYRVLPVHPTQLYSTCCALVLFGVLVYLSTRFTSDGVLFAVMLILYSAVRFSIELFRIDEVSFMGTGLSVSQCVSIGTMLFAVCLLIYARSKREHLPFPVIAEEGAEKDE